MFLSSNSCLLFVGYAINLVAKVCGGIHVVSVGRRISAEAVVGVVVVAVAVVHVDVGVPAAAVVHTNVGRWRNAVGGRARSRNLGRRRGRSSNNNNSNNNNSGRKKCFTEKKLFGLTPIWILILILVLMTD